MQTIQLTTNEQKLLKEKKNGTNRLATKSEMQIVNKHENKSLTNNYDTKMKTCISFSLILKYQSDKNPNIKTLKSVLCILQKIIITIGI